MSSTSRAWAPPLTLPPSPRASQPPMTLAFVSQSTATLTSNLPSRPNSASSGSPFLVSPKSGHGESYIESFICWTYLRKYENAFTFTIISTDCSTLRPANILKCIFFNKKLEFRLKFEWFFPRSPTDNIALVQTMAWCQKGDVPYLVVYISSMLMC